MRDWIDILLLATIAAGVLLLITFYALPAMGVEHCGVSAIERLFTPPKC